MSLTAEEVLAVKAVHAKISAEMHNIGSDAVDRMITVYPIARSYFKDLKSVKAGSPEVKMHGREIADGLVKALNSLDNIPASMAKLNPFHKEQKVLPLSHRLLFHNFLVVMADKFPGNITPEEHVAFDKFLVCVYEALC